MVYLRPCEISDIPVFSGWSNKENILNHDEITIQEGSICQEGTVNENSERSYFSKITEVFSRNNVEQILQILEMAEFDRSRFS